MALFNKLLSAIRVNDDYDEEDDDDDFLDDDDDEIDDDDYDDDDEDDDFDDDDEDEKPSFTSRFRKKMSKPEPEPVRKNEAVPKPTRYSSASKDAAKEPVREKEPFTITRTKPAANTKGSSKVTPIKKKGSSFNNMEVVVIKPASMEDTREIADSLGADHTVILNLEGVDVDVAQRIIDFCCGSTYMISGSLQKVSSYIFILTPNGVEISGDYQDILSSAFDLPNMRADY